ncbi:hypothetical protein BGY98DRAFT_93547 [Russula aff. rugulosa BPL654]|nr:hypothetical protein BGY98DRAFT_93547 [Russula aff. rugulosa BPL654]
MGTLLLTACPAFYLTYYSTLPNVQSQTYHKLRNLATNFLKRPYVQYCIKYICVWCVGALVRVVVFSSVLVVCLWRVARHCPQRRRVIGTRRPPLPHCTRKVPLQKSSHGVICLGGLIAKARIEAKRRETKEGEEDSAGDPPLRFEA